MSGKVPPLLCAIKQPRFRPLQRRRQPHTSARRLLDQRVGYVEAPEDRSSAVKVFDIEQNRGGTPQSAISTDSCGTTVKHQA
jgi:hypothetical protein